MLTQNQRGDQIAPSRHGQEMLRISSLTKGGWLEITPCCHLVVEYWLMDKNPYLRESGPPRMLPSFVCYADILGYAQLSKEAIASGQGDRFLKRLRKALSNAHQRLRNRADGYGFLEKLEFAKHSDFVIKVFTDNIVIGYPLRGSKSFEDGEPELGAILDVLAEYQIGLVQEGFFIRGGIAYGNHYMDEDIVFGKALLEAVELDKSGGPPRLTLAASAWKMVQQHLGYYGSAEHSPYRGNLLKDADGTIFLNYLGEAFTFFYEAGIAFKMIKKHHQHISEGLVRYREEPDVRAKHEWAARYHNFICREFAEAYSGPCDPESVDEYSGALAREAQKLKDYQIDVEPSAPEPSRIA